MKTPNIIYLIDMGDEIVWCDDPNPSGEYDADDSVCYVKAESGYQIVNDSAIAYLFMNHPEVYEEFYKRL